jgi:hypothetical protein
VTPAEKNELLRAARRAVGRLQARVDQIGARVRDEGGEPTEEEWAELRRLAGMADDSLDSHSDSLEEGD